MELTRVSRQVKRLALLGQIGWFLLVAASVWLNYHYSRRELEQTARIEAQAIFQRDMTFRQWFADYGGTYVQVTRKTPPNPYLAHIPNRDIAMPDGTPLTLVNPAYLMRLINESSQSDDAPTTRMTSTKPLRPENAPDPWEKMALERAEGGEQEIFQFTTSNGKPYLRYLHAAPTKAHCLKCHAQQGYKIGDLRGGLSVTLPIGKRLASHELTMRTLYLWHLLIYLLGAGVLFWGQHFVSRRVRERDLAVAALEESERKFRTVADFAYAWEYWLGPEGEMQYVSPSVKELTGHAQEQFMRDPEFIQQLIIEDDRETFHHHLEMSRQNAACVADFRIRTATGEIRWLHHICRSVYDRNGKNLGRRSSNYDITDEKGAKLKNDELIEELREALDKVKILSGFLPICASCKKIRDDQGYWNQIESYLTRHSEAVFSHSICPDCAHRLYPDIYQDRGTNPAQESEQTDEDKA
jgi:PAS domain S-box-containing protein